MSRYWTGDEWRWGLKSSTFGHRTISVIEPSVETDPPKTARRVPFGFSPRDDDMIPETDPILWEGDDS